MSHTHWNIHPALEQSAAIPGLHPLISQLLSNRGITDPHQAELFLNPDQKLEIDPFLLPDMGEAVRRTYQALLSGEKIAIYGDFDADGITATALLVQGLSALGGTVIPYIPHRINEGYGLTIPALEKLHEQGISLIITVDTGITAIHEVAKAHRMGMDIIITDHHEPLGTLPPAKVIVNPKRTDSDYPITELAGVGVAFKFLQAMLKGSDREDLLDKSLDLVALGTVADMIHLKSENRFWVKRGVELLNATNRIGIQEMMRCANVSPGTIDSRTISWTLGPRINAAGRIDNATTSYKLLMTNDPEEARNLAAQLEKKNAERLEITNNLMIKARDKLIADGVDRPLLMASDPDYPQGVMGLVAGRLADQFYRPVILLKPGSEGCRGSARSIAEFDMMAALENNHDLLTKYGGHKMAAGFNVPTKNLESFRGRIMALAHEQLDGLDLRPHIDIDAEVPLSIFTGTMYQQVQQLAPFGMGNPVPIFLSKRVRVDQQRLVGGQGEHLKLKLKENGVLWDAIGFNCGNLAQEVTPELDIVYTVGVDRWNGDEKLRISLLDFAPVR